MIYLYIAVGGAAGAISRFALSRLNIVHSFPYGTQIANIIGSVLIGFFYFYFLRSEISTNVKVFITSGFIAALTTYSTLNLELFLFLEKENYRLFVYYFFLNSFIGIISVFIGKKIADIVT